MIIGAKYGDGVFNLESNSGESYVIFGGNDFTSSVTHAGTATSNTLTGTTAANVMVGGRGNDTIIGNGGADSLVGGQGNDVLAISSLGFRKVAGGTGSDTLRLDGTNLVLNLTTLGNGRIQGIETIDLTGTGNNALTLNRREVLNLSDSSNTLTVRGNSGDSVRIDTGWTRGLNETIGNETFQVFTSGAATLKVSLAVRVRITTIDLTSLGAGGTTIFGADAEDRSGFAVSGAGDVNGDGFDDVAITASYANGLGNASNRAGESYIVFGQPTPLATIDLALLGTPGGPAGFTIIGGDEQDFSGISIHGAGDVNGDGFDDLIIGAVYADGPANQRNLAGESYVIFWSPLCTNHH